MLTQDQKLKTLDIFGKEILVKSYLCANEEREICSNDCINDPRLSLYININDICNAQCNFCEVHNNPSCNSTVDYAKLKHVIEELYYNNILNWIALTGGETFLDIDVINRILGLIYTLDPNILVSINTNGTLFDRINQIEALNQLDGFHISRHHYSDEKNNQIFGKKTASKEELIELRKKLKFEQFRLNCNMIRGFIDNPEEARQYLEFAGDVGAFKTVFVSLMPLNGFCKDSFVDFSELDLLKSSFITRELYDNEFCECKNMIYISSNGKPVDYYYRRSIKQSTADYCKQLVYTCDNKLLSGFGKVQIY